MRVLDIDLDCFLDNVAYWPEGGRLDEEYFHPWPVDNVLRFLRDNCGLTGPLPGFTVERHHEAFLRWRDLIEAGWLTTPFHVTHVDAHSDLGNGDNGYMQLMTDLVFRPVEDRTYPTLGEWGLDEGNYLAYAVGCRWLSALEFVFNDDYTSDLFTCHLEGWRDDATNLQLVGMDKAAVEAAGYFLTRVEVLHREPTVPFRRLLWSDFQTDEPYDLICLCRSPDYTPASSDAIFDAICAEFIGPDPLTASGF